MKTFLLQSVHAQAVTDKMKSMYGDFGKFTNDTGTVNFEPFGSCPFDPHLWVEIKMYAFGYHASIDELAALRAENEALRDLVAKLLMVVGNHTGEIIQCDSVTEKKIITRAHRALESSNG